MDSFMYFLGRSSLFLLGLLAALYAIVFSANVFFDVWGWFAVPAGIPALVNKWHGLGLLLIASYPLLSLSLATNDIKERLDEGKEKTDWLVRMWQKIAISYLGILFFWGFAAVYHWLMTTNPF